MGLLTLIWVMFWTVVIIGGIPIHTYDGFARCAEATGALVLAVVLIGIGRGGSIQNHAGQC